ncbi:Hypothetical predicted protein [Paramuricea clavata]|uniref:Uncharacterized protein n=1 Tax=Paramuricea clavata TaxID=317549 RepID=A0A7D9ICZ3_PARCT|nr:Hypothetical predicted protein [Paramuricea clavata]
MEQEVEGARHGGGSTATVEVAESEPAVESGKDPILAGAESEKKEKGHRGKHKCPFPSCSAEVIHLPRHMRQVHRWDKPNSAGVVSAFSLRKPRKGTGKSTRKHKVCPVDGCMSVVKRIHNHLVDFHGMKSGSNVYKRSLKSAVHHQVIDISSESSCESSSIDEEELRSYKEISKAPKRKEKKKEGEKVKKVKHESIFKKVYSSDDEDDSDYPSIFRGPCTEKEREHSHELSNAEESPMPERDEEMSEERSSEKQETTDQSSSDGSYIDDSEVESVHLSSPLDMLPDERVFKQFEEWLQTADGGRREKPIAQQCSRQIQLVIQYICPEKPNLKDILDRKTLRDKWLHKFEKERRPGTVKSYLGALRQFYSFLECESPMNIDAPPKALSALIVQMAQWSKSYHKLVKNRFWEKRMDDLEKLRKPEQIQKFIFIIHHSSFLF